MMNARADRLRRGLLLALGAAGLASGPATAATEWSIIHDDSRLGFEATQQGGEFEGRFESFRADMRFSADDLAASGFDVRIDTASVETGSSQRDSALPNDDWFNVDAFGEATYVADTIRATEDGYAAEGTLTIRGNSHPVTLPFTWQVDGDRAMMDGAVVIDRTRYGVGQGDWSDPSVAGHDVRVVVDLTLSKAD
ncbi:YceI family protein [Spiribacter roseus]|uniref:YceI family protein n=1 Tax=Spiribacter roseus TaxID=1855875 RepID=A0ABV3S069_9GAMM